MVQQFHSWVLSPKNEKCQLLSRDRVFAIPRIVAYQALLFMEFSRQEYWSGLPLPSPGDLPNPGIEPGSPAIIILDLSSLSFCCLLSQMVLK